MNSILIVDDETQIRELIKKYALHDGYHVIEASNGKEAIEIAKHEKPDIIIMDIMMPVLDGYSAVKEIRKMNIQSTCQIPIILLSARSEEYDKIYGFDLGVDDYVTKPFSPKELMMRVNAVLNRYRLNQDNIDNSNIISYQTIKIDLSARIVLIDECKVELTPKEYELLIYLIKNANVAIKREELMKQIWNTELLGEDRTLDTHIKSLRKKIGKYSDNIVTLRRVGYRFEIE